MMACINDDSKKSKAQRIKPTEAAAAVVTAGGSETAEAMPQCATLLLLFILHSFHFFYANRMKFGPIWQNVCGCARLEIEGITNRVAIQVH